MGRIRSGVFGPEGFTVVEVPADWDHTSPLLSCFIRYRIKGSELIYARHLKRSTGVLEKKDYETLRLITQKLEEAERRPLILKRVL
jgi:hypothetical protein